MIQSLYTGLSGLMNFQRAIDVTANNAANISTTAFKYSRVTFKTAFEYMLNNAPSNTIGGGTMLNTIDRNMSLGSIENTNQFGDLAIGGSGFFVAGEFRTDQNGNLVKTNSYLTRLGKFEILSDMNLVQGDIGLHILGLPSTVDANGQIIPVDIPDSQTMLRMTQAEKATFFNNLSPIDLTKYQMMKGKASDGFAVYGTSILKSNVGPEPLIFEKAGAVSGTAYKVRMTFEERNPKESTGIAEDFYLSGSGFIQVKMADGSIGYTKQGTFDISGTTLKLKGGEEIQPPLTIPAGASAFRIAQNGEVTVLVGGDRQVVGSISAWKFDNPGGMEATATSFYKETPDSGTPNQGVGGQGEYGIFESGVVLNDLFFTDEKTYTFNLELLDNSTSQPILNGISSGSSGTITFGATDEIIKINGLPASKIDFTITGETSPFTLSKAELEDNQTGISYENPEAHASLRFFDQQGAPVVDGLFFEKYKQGQWLFKPERTNANVDAVSFIASSGEEYSFNDPDLNLLGGVLQFNSAGSYTGISLVKKDGTVIADVPEKIKYTFLDGSTQEIAMDMSLLRQGSLVNLGSQINLVQEGGWTTGSLNGFEFDNTGNLIGNYTNGEDAVLARIPLVQVRTPESLLVSDMYSTAYEFNPDPAAPRNMANNFTGIFTAGDAGTGVIQPYSLEYSNVDMAKEMTKLIMYQRALQLNARTVTTADTILQEAYQLKR